MCLSSSPNGATLSETFHLPIFYGSGANGKSVFLKTILELLGSDYAMTAPPDLLMAKTHANHPTELADLFGKRFVCSIEIDSGRRLAEALVKALTGGENVRARRMREDFWEFPPTHKFVLACNSMPIVRGQDNGIWRRLALFPFEVRFWDPDRGESGLEHLRQDKNLLETLATELPGILNWCLLGCAEWQSEGLNMPSKVQAATAAYRAANDSISVFIDECCVVSSGAVVGATPLLARYAGWCEDNHDSHFNRTEFKQALERQGFTQGRFTAGPNKGKAMWNGLGLRASEESEASSGSPLRERALREEPEHVSLSSPENSPDQN